MAESLETLKKRFVEEEKALKAKHIEKLTQAKKREARASTVESKKRRKIENHGKYLLAGFVLAEAKATGKIDKLEEYLKSLTKDRDREAIKALMALVQSSSKPVGGKPSSKVSQSSTQQPKKEAPQKS